MTPGSYFVHLYDRNIDTGSDDSVGWDGGVVYLTDAAGCPLANLTIGYEDKYADSAIYAAVADVSIPPEGSACEGSPLDVSGFLADPVGSPQCLIEPNALMFCASRPTADGGDDDGGAGAASALGRVLAPDAMCDAICAATACDNRALELFGPVPLSMGCCEQSAGYNEYPFSLWLNGANNTDYGLFPLTSADAAASVVDRYVARNNKVIMGLVVSTTRLTTGECPAAPRFAHLEDSAQPLQRSLPLCVNLSPSHAQNCCKRPV